MDGVTVGLDGGNDDCAMFILECFGLLDSSRTSADSFFVNACSVIDSERDIFDTVTVLGVVS